MKQLSMPWAVVISLILSPVYADLKGGIKAGGNMHHMWSIDEGISEIKLGFLGGFFLRYKPFEVFAIQPELLFVLKGGKYVDSKDTSLYVGKTVIKTNSFTTSMNVVEVPILFKIYPPGFYNAQPHIILGPVYNFVISRDLKATCSIKENTQINVCSDDGSLDGFSKPSAETGADEKHLLGIVLGGGIDFGLGTCDLRYSMGIQEVESSPPPGNADALILRGRTGTLSIMFGFLF